MCLRSCLMQSGRRALKMLGLWRWYSRIEKFCRVHAGDSVSYKPRTSPVINYQKFSLSLGNKCAARRLKVECDEEGGRKDEEKRGWPRESCTRFLLYILFFSLYFLSPTFVAVKRWFPPDRLF